MIWTFSNSSNILGIKIHSATVLIKCVPFEKSLNPSNCNSEISNGSELRNQSFSVLENDSNLIKSRFKVSKMVQICHLETLKIVGNDLTKYKERFVC